MTKGKVNNPKKAVTDDPRVARAALEYLFASRYIDRKRLYLENFYRGMFFSIGSIVGIVLVGTLVLWLLSFFDSIPFIDKISRAIEASLN